MSKITKIEQQKRNKHRFSIYIDGVFAFGIHEDVMVKFRLEKGNEIDKHFIENVVKEEEQNKANNYALNLLSYRARSEKEIKNKMFQKGYEDSIIDQSIEFLYRYKYLDDKEFALSFAKDKINLKSAGEKLIRQELFYKGISSDIINDVINVLMDEDKQYTAALELAKKKLNSTYKHDDKQAKQRKLCSFLQRKGYSYSIVSRVLKEVL
ncbi:RecX family transcriptional regulator [Alkaliphilus sp. B6464]|uniref:RecX family transcriptional regulator n=1 Tax=Alkaliphilus sp. B6464 TaxID=2731219 RepID=UPI001BA5DAFE|nr:RecX family transcriptional regulator [Alkaliphilus sp. B6464]QUH22160.1 RecX family transcriptional regulator [Alkaliphilus sp. B6464]